MLRSVYGLDMKNGLLVAAVLVVLVAAGYLYAMRYQLHVRSVQFLTLADGSRVALVRGARHTAMSRIGELDLVDLSTGRLRKRVRAGGLCVPADAGRIWCTDDDTPLELRDAATLSVVDDLAAPLHALPAPPLRHNAARVLDGGVVLLATNDGKQWRIDAAERRFTPQPSRNAPTFEHFGSRDATTTSVAGGPPPPPRGAFLCDPAPHHGECAPLRLPGSNALVTVRRDNVEDDDRAHLVLSALGPDDKVLWSTQTGRGVVIAAAQADDLVYVGVGEPGHYLVALDAHSGAVRWRWH
jgi:hypothetical protein